MQVSFLEVSRIVRHCRALIGYTVSSVHLHMEKIMIEIKVWLCVSVCACQRMFGGFEGGGLAIRSSYNVTFYGKHCTLILNSSRSLFWKPHPLTLIQSNTTGDFISCCLTCIINHKSILASTCIFSGTETKVQRNKMFRSLFVCVLWACFNCTCQTKMGYTDHYKCQILNDHLSPLKHPCRLDMLKTEVWLKRKDV